MLGGSTLEEVTKNPWSTARRRRVFKPCTYGCNARDSDHVEATVSMRITSKQLML